MDIFIRGFDLSLLYDFDVNNVLFANDLLTLSQAGREVGSWSQATR